MIDVSEIVKAIDVARIEGLALVLMKTPHGRITVNGAEVSCASISRGLCQEIEAKLPGVAAIPVPMGWDVEVHSAGGRNVDP